MTRNRNLSPDSWVPQSRRVAFWAGLIGVAYEAVFEEVDRPWLFLVFLTMMGLAQFGRVFEVLSPGKNGGMTLTLGRSGTSTQPPANPSGQPTEEKGAS